jgi:hypothetical protein
MTTMIARTPWRVSARAAAFAAFASGVNVSPLSVTPGLLTIRAAF